MQPPLLPISIAAELLAVCLLERLRESFDFGCVYVADDQESQAVRLPGFDGEGVVSAGVDGSREG